MGLYKILVVDDDIDSALPVLGALDAAGYDVATARDGWDGLSQARRLHPDLVLLDVTMPAMDGWTFMKFIRAHRDLAAIPVIFVTGSSSPEDRERGLKLGASGWLTKPVATELLLAEIAAVLDRRGEIRERDTEIQRTSRLRMSGRIDQMGLPALLTILGAGARTGVLEFRRTTSGDCGRLLLREGRVSSARVEGLRSATGLDAVEQLGKWRDGTFIFTEEEVLIADDATASVPRV